MRCVFVRRSDEFPRWERESNRLRGYRAGRRSHDRITLGRVLTPKGGGTGASVPQPQPAAPQPPFMTTVSQTFALSGAPLVLEGGGCGEPAPHAEPEAGTAAKTAPQRVRDVMLYGPHALNPTDTVRAGIELFR